MRCGSHGDDAASVHCGQALRSVARVLLQGLVTQVLRLEHFFLRYSGEAGMSEARCAARRCRGVQAQISQGAWVVVLGFCRMALIQNSLMLGMPNARPISFCGKCHTQCLSILLCEELAIPNILSDFTSVCFNSTDLIACCSPGDQKFLM